MKRVSIAVAKQTLPALVHEVEKAGEIELTRRGRTVAYIVSAERMDQRPRRTFVEALEAWRERFGNDVGDEPLQVPPRKTARRVDFP